MSARGPERITFGQLIAEGALEVGDGYRARNDELGGTGILFLTSWTRDRHPYRL
jgi:type I restriction enzyme S subunit